ncbi:MAG: enoyl-CoA hydratase-related protein, partial [Dongiaceae bacterium]
MSKLIRIERRGPVLELTVDRPKANAFDGPTSKALGEALVAYQQDDGLRCAIITGAGEKFFSGGWDLKVAAELGLDELNVDYGPGGFAGLTEMWTMRKPVVAALNGMTIGGGWELALACDIVIAADHVRFWMPEVQRGIIA